MGFVVALDGRLVVALFAAERQETAMLERVHPEILDFAALVAAKFAIKSNILKANSHTITI
jgi:hypothetical protein